MAFAIHYFFTIDFGSAGLKLDLIVVAVLGIISIVVLLTNKYEYGTFDKDP